jgi:phage tail tube protein FII
MAALLWRKNRVVLNKVDYVGQITEASVELKREMAEFKGQGMPGAVKVPSGNFEAATAKIKFDSISPKDMREIIAKDGYVTVTYSGECRGLDSLTGTSKVSGMTTTLRGYSEDVLTQNPNNEGKSEGEITINLMFIEMKDKDGVILMIDWAKGLVEPEALA